MTTFQPTVSPDTPEPTPPLARGSQMSVFDLMCTRMRGTVRIVGDIVGPDQEALESEGE